MTPSIDLCGRPNILMLVDTIARGESKQQPTYCGGLLPTVSSFRSTFCSQPGVGREVQVLLVVVLVLHALQEKVASSMAPDAPAQRRQHQHQAQQQAQQHLILHFDINETILVGDEAGGDTRQDCFNKMLAKSAFVRMPATTTSSTTGTTKYDYESTSNVVPTHWWNGSPLRDDTTTSDGDDVRVDEIPPLHTDWQWPIGCCPYYRTAYKKRAKTFVEHHGKIYRNVYDRLRIAFPGHVGDHHPHDDKQHHRSTAAAIDDTFSHILPGFFHTLRNLPDDCTTTTIVLRTFGSDLPDIAAAVTAFARGQHPDHSDYVNESLVLTEDALVQGRWAKTMAADDPTLRNGGNKINRCPEEEERDLFVYQLWKKDQLVASGDADVLQFLHSHTICGIQDHYEHWRDHKYEPWAGKPVWVPNDPKYHHVLLDDNIHNLEHDSIASVRMQEASGRFRTLSGKEIQKQQGHCLVRVPTVAPILNRHWFLEQIDKARERHSVEKPS